MSGVPFSRKGPSSRSSVGEDEGEIVAFSILAQI